ncbi:putative RecD-like DNA helicase YrrC [Streptomyces misionensis JCM 4497]
MWPPTSRPWPSPRTSPAPAPTAGWPRPPWTTWAGWTSSWRAPVSAGRATSPACPAPASRNWSARICWPPCTWCAACCPTWSPPAPGASCCSAPSRAAWGCAARRCTPRSRPPWPRSPTPCATNCAAPASASPMWSPEWSTPPSSTGAAPPTGAPGRGRCRPNAWRTRCSPPYDAARTRCTSPAGCGCPPGCAGPRRACTGGSPPNSGERRARAAGRPRAVRGPGECRLLGAPAPGRRHGHPGGARRDRGVPARAAAAAAPPRLAGRRRPADAVRPAPGLGPGRGQPVPGAAAARHGTAVHADRGRPGVPAPPGPPHLAGVRRARRGAGGVPAVGRAGAGPHRRDLPRLADGRGSGLLRRGAAGAGRPHGTGRGPRGAAGPRVRRVLRDHRRAAQGDRRTAAARARRDVRPLVAVRHRRRRTRRLPAPAERAGRRLAGRVPARAHPRRRAHQRRPRLGPVRGVRPARAADGPRGHRHRADRRGQHRAGERPLRRPGLGHPHAGPPAGHPAPDAAQLNAQPPQEGHHVIPRPSYGGRTAAHRARRGPHRPGRHLAAGRTAAVLPPAGRHRSAPPRRPDLRRRPRPGRHPALPGRPGRAGRTRHLLRARRARGAPPRPRRGDRPARTRDRGARLDPRPALAPGRRPRDHGPAPDRPRRAGHHRPAAPVVPAALRHPHLRPLAGRAAGRAAAGAVVRLGQGLARGRHTGVGARADLRRPARRRHDPAPRLRPARRPRLLALRARRAPGDRPGLPGGGAGGGHAAGARARGARAGVRETAGRGRPAVDGGRVVRQPGRRVRPLPPWGRPGRGRGRGRRGPGRRRRGR